LLQHFFPRQAQGIQTVECGDRARHKLVEECGFGPALPGLFQKGGLGAKVLGDKIQRGPATDKSCHAFVEVYMVGGKGGGMGQFVEDEIGELIWRILQHSAEHGIGEIAQGAIGAHGSHDRVIASGDERVALADSALAFEKTLVRH
tara:strand:+ start:1731 stop:2168 length:438 start_codon:yes stop_codon:yes gene_type:complete